VEMNNKKRNRIHEQIVPHLLRGERTCRREKQQQKQEKKTSRGGGERRWRKRPSLLPCRTPS
jgi:hypothetical protein